MVEICVDNIQSAINAENAGAFRIELCSALGEGGLTPSCGMLEFVKSVLSIPIFVMLRPRKGMDFVYTEQEILSMKFDIKHLKSLGADGFVFGILNSDATVNTTACKELLDLISPLPATFHRAFDVVRDPYDSLLKLIELGFKRVLTSGQKDLAINGIPTIKKLVEISDNRIIVMPGSGINVTNVSQILNETRVREIHASCKKASTFDFPHHKSISTIGVNDNNNLIITDPEIVRSMVIVYENYKKDVLELN